MYQKCFGNFEIRRDKPIVRLGNLAERGLSEEGLLYEYEYVNSTYIDLDGIFLYDI